MYINYINNINEYFAFIGFVAHIFGFIYISAEIYHYFMDKYEK